MKSFEESSVVISVPWDFARDVPQARITHNILVYNNLSVQDSAHKTPKNQSKLTI